MISVVCPFFNESAIIEGATRHMLAQLRGLDTDWELILVNDGSRDDSFALAKALEAEDSRLQVIGYDINKGRGFALATGIRAARGDIVVTTEVDCSWGDDIVGRIVAKFRAEPSADIVIASPNIDGGGYRNVPAKRVAISRIGNLLLRLAQSSRITMYTGMTRGYRRRAFLELPIDENGKEFHLDVIRKSLAFNFKIVEVPAILEWKEHKFSKPNAAKRKSSANIPALVASHLIVALSADPFRYLCMIGGAFAAIALVPFAFAIYNLVTQVAPSAFWALLGMSLLLFGVLCVAMGILALQNLSIQQDLWRIRREIFRYSGRSADAEDAPGGDDNRPG